MNIVKFTKKIYRKVTGKSTPNLLGDRAIEFAFINSQLPLKGRNILDFGSGGSPLSLTAYLKGHKVTAIDLLPFQYKYKINMQFVQDDILTTNKLKENYFDTIINCSSIEHIGLSGRYGVINNISDGDIYAMAQLRKLLKKNGLMLMTIPMGKDKTINGMHRIYGKKRLPILLSGFIVLKEIYWIKNSDNLWIEAKKTVALNTEGSEIDYALGCFVLKKS